MPNTMRKEGRTVRPKEPLALVELKGTNHLTKEQKQQIEYYENEIKETKEYLYALQNDTTTMEKVAREQYMMKRDNEVVYLIDTQE